MKDKVVIKNGDFRVVPMSKEEEKRQKEYLKKKKKDKNEDQSGRIAANWFRN